MVGIVSGNGIGLLNTSQDVLDLTLGQTGLGQANGKAYVNAATGNLSVQFLDESLSGTGADLLALRTYNSLGALNDGDADGWRWQGERRVVLSGTVNTAGSTITRTSGDGSQTVFAWDGSKYISQAGSAAHDALTWNAAGAEWVFNQDASGDRIERYSGTTGWIKNLRDSSGNGFDFIFVGDKLATVRDVQSGQTLEFTYSVNHGKLIRIDTRTTAAGVLSQQVHYDYDSSLRLQTVIMDLSAGDNSLADGKIYFTTYTYSGSSNRIASIAQSDGTSASFTYDGSNRIQTVTDQTGTTTFAYSSSTAVVTNGAGNSWTYTYDTLANNNRLKKVESTAVKSVKQSSTYNYDASGNISSIVDGRNNTITYSYDGKGNRTKEVDSLGNTITRTFDATNHLITETRYLFPSLAAPGGTETARYIYDSAGRLRFTVSAQGRVSETRYNSQGLVLQSLQYAGGTYNLAGLEATASLSEAQLTTWLASLSGAQKVQTQIVAFTYDYRGNINSKTSFANVDSAGVGILDSAADVSEYLYNEYGQVLLTIATTGTGHATKTIQSSVTYDGLGRQISVISNGATTTTAYSGATITVSNTATGLTILSTTDSAGRLTSVKQTGDSTNRISTYYYDAAGRLRMSEDPTGGRSYIFYDAAGRVSAKVNAMGATTAYSYDADGRVLTEVQYSNAATTNWLNGTKTSITIGAAGSDVVWDAANDRTTTRTYDAAGRLSTTTVDGALVTTHYYDGESRLIQTTQGSQINKYYYDADGRQVGKLDAERYLTENVYDGVGRLIKTLRYGLQANGTQQISATFAALKTSLSIGASLAAYYYYDGEGRQVGVVNEQGSFTATVYDTALNRRQTIQYTKAIAVAANETFASLKARAGSAVITTTGYDSYGRVDAVTAHDGTITRSTYDAAGRLVRQIEAWSSSDQRAARTRYNAFSEVIGVISGVGETTIALSALDPAIATGITNYGTRYEMDGAGRKTAEYGPDGQKTFLFYNAAGQLTYTVNALGETAKTEYNSFGQVKATVVYSNRIMPASLATITAGGPESLIVNILPSASWSAYGFSFIADSKSITYNKLGLTAQTDENGIITTNNYNIYGQLNNVVRNISADVTTTTLYEYDLLGRVKATIADNGGLAAKTSVVYDGFGKLINNIDANGKTTISSYLDDGRTIVITDPLGRSNRTEVDALGRTLKSVDALGNVTTYAYDDVNRKTTVTHPDGTSIISTKTRTGETLQVQDEKGNLTKYTYTKDGKLDTVTDALGVVTTDNNYYLNGRLYETLDGNKTVTQYAFDVANRIVQKTVDPTGLNIHTKYEFDGSGRQIMVTEGFGTPAASATEYLYGHNGKIKQIIVDPTGLKLSTTFTYDGLGQTTVVEKGTVDLPTQEKTLYTFDKLGRKTKEQVDPSVLNITTQFKYDANGNLIQKIDANTVATNFVYDAANQLRFTIDALGAVTERRYDVAGHLIKEIQYANTLSATQLASSTTLATLGTNRLSNGTFSNPTNGLPEGWTLGFWNTPAQVNINTSSFFTVAGLPAGDNTVELQQGARNEAGAYQDLSQSISAIEAGKRYAFSAYTGSYRATASILILWYDASGNLLGQSEENAASRNVSEQWGGTSLSGYKRIVAEGIAPAGAAKAVAILRKQNTNATEANSFLFAAHAQFEEIPLNVTQPSTWVSNLIKPSSEDRSTNFTYDKAGRLRLTVAADGAVTERRYDATGKVIKEIQYANTLTENQIASPTTLAALGNNRLNNATFSNPTNGLPEGWTLSYWNSPAQPNVNIGSLFTVAGLAAGDNTVALQQDGRDSRDSYQDLSQSISAIEAGKQYAFSAYTGSYRASVNILIMWYDANGKILGNSEENAASRNLSEQWGGSSLAGYKRIVAKGIAPAGATKAVAILRKRNTNVDQTNSFLFAAHAQFEELPLNVNQLSPWESLIKSSTNDRATNFVYDKVGRLRFTVAAEGAVTERQYDAAGQVTKEIQYANALTENQIASPTTLAALGNNRLTNATFSNPTNGLPEGWALNFSGASAQPNINDSSFFTVTGLAAGDNTVSLQQNGRHSTAAYQDLSQSISAIEAGKRYAFSAYTGSYRATVSIHIVWYDANGNTLTNTQENAASHNVSEQPGGNSLASYKRIVAEGIAPAGATRAVAILRKHNTNEGEPNSFLFAAHAQFEELPLSINKPSLWMSVSLSNADRITNFAYDKAGRLRFTVDALGYVSENTYDAMGNVKTITQFSTAPALTSYSESAITTAMNNINLAVNKIDSKNRVSAYTYDAAGRQTVSTLPGWYDIGDGKVYAELDGQSDRFQRSVQVTYDAMGKAVVNKIRTGMSTYIYQYKAYDAVGREVYDVDALGYVTQKSYDDSGNINKVIRFGDLNSALGAPTDGYWSTSAIASQLSGKTGRTIVYKYDLLGRKLSVAQPSSAINYISGNNSTPTNVDTATLYPASAFTSYEYNTFGDMVKQNADIDTVTKASSYLYHDKVGRQTWAVDAEGYATKTSYNAFGNITSTLEYSKAPDAIDLQSLSTTRVPDSIYTANAKDRETRLSYDVKGQVKTTSRKLNGVLTEVNSKDYNAFGNAIKSWDAKKNLTEMEYNKLDKVSKIIEPVRTVASTGIDVFVNQVLATPITVMEYDAFGQSFKQTRSSNVGLGATVVVSHEFDLVGNEVKTTDARNNVIEMTYDSNGRMLRQTQSVAVVDATADINDGHTIEHRYEYDVTGRQTASLDVFAGRTKVSGQVNIFNGYGEVFEERKVWGSASSSAVALLASATSNVLVSSYEYDGAGRIQHKTSADGHVYFYYNLMGDVTRTEQRESTTPTATDRITESYHNKLGHLLVQRLARFSATLTDALGSATTSPKTPVIIQTLDRWGNVISRTDATAYESSKTTYGYNQDNQLVSEKGPTLQTIKYSGALSKSTTLEHKLTYDSLGQITEDTYESTMISDLYVPYGGTYNGVKYPYGMTLIDGDVTVGIQKTKNVYNQVGQLVSTIDPTNVEQRYVYDSNGNRAGSRDALGHITVYKYNLNNQMSGTYLLRQIVANEEVEYSTLNPLTGTLTSIRLAEYRYDQAGRKYGEADALGNYQYYKYDERGNILIDRNRVGGKKSYVFDELGNKTSETQSLTATTNIELNSWTYNKTNSYKSQRATTHTAAGIAYNYTYTGFGEVKTETRSGTTVTYDYWENGLQKSISEVSVNNERGTFTANNNSYYYYDIKGNRTAEVNDSSYDQSAFTRVFESSPKLTLNGLVEKKQHSFTVNGHSGSGGVSTYYKYDVQNRLVLTTSPSSRIVVDRDNFYTSTLTSLSYSYDEWGNRRRIVGDTKHSGYDDSWTEWYAYDAANRVTVEAGVSNSTTAVIAKPEQSRQKSGIFYQYDGAGRRVSEEQYINSNTTKDFYTINYYTYNDLGLVSKVSNKTVSRNKDTNSAASSQTTKAEFTTDKNAYDNRGFKRENLHYVDGFSGANDRTTTTTYNADGTIFDQTAKVTSGANIDHKELVQGDYTYDLMGNVLSYNIYTYNITNNDDPSITTYTYVYVNTYLGRQVGNIAVGADGAGPGKTTNTYDNRGRQVSAVITERYNNGNSSGDSYRKYTYNASGQIITRAQKLAGGSSYSTQNYYYAKGSEIANIGGSGVDISPLTAISKGGSTPGSYTVNADDTLMGIAQSLFGDARLWYLIADANGLHQGPTEAFAPSDIGRNLRIPNNDKNIGNTSSNYKPYNASEIIGDLTPSTSVLPPPKAKGCNVVAMIVMVVIAVVLTVVTAGAAAVAMGAVASGTGVVAAGTAVLSGSLIAGGMVVGSVAAGMGLAAATMAAAFVGGVVGSIGSQLVGKAMGVVEHFSMRQAIGSGLTAGFAAGAGTALNGLQAGSALVSTNAQGVKDGLSLYGNMARGAASYAGAYASNKIAGLETHFNWTDMAVATIAPSLGGGIASGNGIASTAINNLWGSAISSSLSRLVGRGEKQDWGAMAADAFGNALASYVVEKFATPKIDLHLLNDLDWDQMAADKEIFGDDLGWASDFSDADQQILLASNDDSAFIDAKKMKYLNEQRVTELSEFGDITDIESSEKGIIVYMESDGFNNLNANKPNAGLIGRSINSTLIGAEGGVIKLMPDKHQEIVGLQQQLRQAENDLDQSYAFLRISDEFVASRDRKDLVVASGEVSLERGFFTGKTKYSSDGGFSASIESDKLFRRKDAGIYQDSSTESYLKLGFDTKGRISLDDGLMNLKQPTPISDADTSTKFEYKINDWDSVGFEGSRAILGWSTLGPKKITIPGVGMVAFKLEAGADVLEFSQRIVDPFAITMDKLNLKKEVQSIIHQQQQKVNWLKNKIDNFVPTLKPVTIHYSPKNKA